MWPWKFQVFFGSKSQRINVDLKGVASRPPARVWTEALDVCPLLRSWGAFPCESEKVSFCPWPFVQSEIPLSQDSHVMKTIRDAAGYEAGELIIVLWRLDCCAVIEILVLSTCSLFRTGILSEGFKTWKLVLALIFEGVIHKTWPVRVDTVIWTENFCFLDKLFFYFGMGKNWSK